MVIGTKISKNYAWELAFFYVIRKFKDGINFVNFESQIDLYKSDHNPHISARLIVLNVLVFEFGIYNVNHVDKPDTREFVVQCPKCNGNLSVRVEK